MAFCCLELIQSITSSNTTEFKLFTPSPCDYVPINNSRWAPNWQWLISASRDGPRVTSDPSLILLIEKKSQDIKVANLNEVLTQLTFKLQVSMMNSWNVHGDESYIDRLSRDPLVVLGIFKYLIWRETKLTDCSNLRWRVDTVWFRDYFL